MREYLKFYIDGQWVLSSGSKVLDVENPAMEAVCGRIALATDADVDKAVGAARAAFPGWSATSVDTRIELLKSIAAEYETRAKEMADAITEEMGAPTLLAQKVHVSLGLAQLSYTIDVLKNFKFEERQEGTLLVKEPIGVCALITPWNWPLNQIAVKVFPAMAAGCTMVLKPSEIAPFSAQIFAEILEAAGIPPGVFNMINGDGAGAGTALSAHPDVDMVSFTGSTRAGIEVAMNAAPGVKRVAQELGGKGVRILLDDSLFQEGVVTAVIAMMSNCGQTCAAGSRLLVPYSRMDEAIDIARKTALKLTVGDPWGQVDLGPVASRAQFEKIQRMIQEGIDSGAGLVAGGIGKPQGIAKGYYVKPTIFAPVSNDMPIAREEIFGPVLAIIGYETVDHAIEIANDTEFGLSNYIHAEDKTVAASIARKLRSGQVSINNASNLKAPFGGFKKSGNGREWGEHGFEEFLEKKAIIGL